MVEFSSFGTWLRQRRRALDLTQDALARQVGYTTATIKKIEQDERRPSRELAERLADVLQVPADERDAFLKSARGQLAADRLATVPGAVASSPPAPRPVSNLPVQRERLIGREREVAQVRALLLRDEVGLVTVTGPGGVGKTRLAFAVAADMLPSFADGVFVVDLAPIHDSALVASTIASTLNLRENAGQALIATLIAYLRDKQVLLVLDNFEQVVHAAPLLAALLDAAAGLKLLVTSRAALQLHGEQLLYAAPLALPPPGPLPPLETLRQFAAVQLFLRRAQAAAPDLDLTPENAPAVATICARLDGLPLAIELAAARSNVLAPTALLNQLDSRLALLTGGPRDAPVRQRTLHYTLDWSYALLDPRAQTLFHRLAIFVSSWTVEAVAAVCYGTADRVPPMLDEISALIDHSLVQPHADAAESARFGMLETIREYALARLVESGEAGVMERAHTAYYVRLAEATEADTYGHTQVAWVARVAADYGNLRSVLQRSLDHNEVDHALRVATALFKFWRLRGGISEGLYWFHAALDRSQVTVSEVAWPLADTSAATRSRTMLRAKALDAAGQLALQVDSAQAIPFLEESIAIWQQLGDMAQAARSHRHLGYVLHVRGDQAGARRHYEHSLALARTLGDEEGSARALTQLGETALAEGNVAEAAMLHEAALTHFRTLGNPYLLAWSLNGLGLVAQVARDYPRAARLHDESLAIFRRLQLDDQIGWSLTYLAWAVQMTGDDAQATALHQESLGLFRALGSIIGVGTALRYLGRMLAEQGAGARAAERYEESLAVLLEVGGTYSYIFYLADYAKLAGHLGQPICAARLFGAADGQREANGGLIRPVSRAHIERDTAATRGHLDEATFWAAWAEGRAMTLEQAIRYAREVMA